MESAEGMGSQGAVTDVSERIRIFINDREFRVPRGTSVAVALLNHWSPAFRRSVTGERRGPLCGMGVCFECRVSIDGRPGVRACLAECRPEMRISIEEADAASGV
ncbi:MAG: 2Fe-2S iron-sulfur cluster-binding protein [Acidobacteriota bacterium]